MTATYGCSLLLALTLMAGADPFAARAQAPSGPVATAGARLTAAAAPATPPACGTVSQWVIGGCANDVQRPCTHDDDCADSGPCMGSSDDAVGYRKWQTTWPVDTPGGGEETDLVVLVNRTFYGNAYTIQDAYLRWDTSALPDDAVICRAWIDLFENTSDNEPTGFGVVELDWGYTERPASDLMWSSGTERGDAATWKVPYWQVGRQRIDLSNLNHINRTGYTGVRLRYVGGQPADVNDFDFRAWGHPTSSGPVLHVEWSAPPAAHHR